MRIVIRKTIEVIWILIKLLFEIVKIPCKIIKAIHDIRVAVAR